MDIIELLLRELDAEAATTRKFLERVPVDQFGYKPHEKSMELKPLSTHIAELPSWVKMAITTDELDFATAPYTPKEVASNDDLIRLHEDALMEARGALKQTNLEELSKEWVLRNGEAIYSRSSKYDVIRMSYSQIVHHRAQLGVYLRLLNIPIPGSYGPSADENDFG